LNEGYSREMRAKWKEVFHLIMLRYRDSYVGSYRAVFDNFLSKVALSSRFDGTDFLWQHFLRNPSNYVILLSTYFKHKFNKDDQKNKTDLI
jgi:hypothetical protein